jgi:hypothetical protein
MLPPERARWRFLLEPILLGLAVRPSWSGALVAAAFILGFLTRKLLRIALQDALREHSHRRTRRCWLLALLYASAAIAALTAAVTLTRPLILIPIGLVAPLAITRILYDANQRGRALLPELAGAAALASSASAIAIAGGMRMIPAFALSGVIVARAIPSSVLLRMLRAGVAGRPDAPIALHAIAILLVATFASNLAVCAMVLLLVRATWTLSYPNPPVRIIEWREAGWGAVVVALVAVGNLLPHLP